LGPAVKERLFDKKKGDVVGQMVIINNVNFRIIGVAEEKGSSGSGNEDNTVYIPLSTMKQFLTNDENLTSISVMAKDGKLLEQTKKEVTRLLLSKHGSNGQLNGIQVLSQNDLVATISQAARVLTLLLGAIAGISLLVGGIGIMNMMFTSVAERTKEIGLRRAIGATRRNIIGQFLAESVVLCLGGATIGIPAGWLGAALIARLGGIRADISLLSVLLAVGVSFLIGILFGYLPARRAALVEPIAALRYE
jgi:putative ABC transport system permease protein